MDHGPRASQSVAWKSQHDDHLPAVSKFHPPEDFLKQLNSQVYGPTTLLIASNVSDLYCQHFIVSCLSCFMMLWPNI